MKTDREAFIEDMKNMLGTMQTGVDEKISVLAGKVEEQTNEFASVRADMKELKKKV